MWDDKLRDLAQEGFRRRPQSPLRGARPRRRRNAVAEEPVVERAPYVGVGCELKAARENQGRSLVEISDALHIQPRYLQAIEEGRFDDLPGATYATGFMRAYCRHLGLPPEEVVQRSRQESNLAHGPTRLVTAEAATPRRPRLLMILLPLLAAAALYAGWSLFAGNGNPTESAVEPAPDRLAMLLNNESAKRPPAEPAAVEPVPRRLIEAAAAVGGPSADGLQAVQPAQNAEAVAAAAREAQRDADATVTAPPPAARAEPLPPAEKPAQGTSDSGEDTPPDDPTIVTVDVPQPAPQLPPPPQSAVHDAAAGGPPPPPPSAADSAYVPQHFGSAEGESRVLLKAKIDSWVQIQAGRNKNLLTRILRAGDTFRAPDRTDLLLTTGNVGGLEIIVDGEPLQPLGPVGAVRRNISLDAEKLLAMAAEAGRAGGPGR